MVRPHVRGGRAGRGWSPADSDGNLLSVGTGDIQRDAPAQQRRNLPLLRRRCGRAVAVGAGQCRAAGCPWEGSGSGRAAADHRARETLAGSAACWWREVWMGAARLYGFAWVRVRGLRRRHGGGAVRIVAGVVGVGAGVVPVVKTEKQERNAEDGEVAQRARRKTSASSARFSSPSPEFRRRV